MNTTKEQLVWRSANNQPQACRSQSAWHTPHTAQCRLLPGTRMLVLLALTL